MTRKSKRYRWGLQHISKVSTSRRNLDQSGKKLHLSIRLKCLLRRFSRMIPKAFSSKTMITYIKPSTRKWWILLVLPNTSEKAYSITTQEVKCSRLFSVAQIWAQPLLPQERLQSTLGFRVKMNYLILNQENLTTHCKLWWNKLLPRNLQRISKFPWVNLRIRWCRKNDRAYRQQETWT